jgi:hypothetical protein
LKAASKHFVLYGETSLAFRLGHRVSTDFDFFTNATFEPQELAERIPYLLRWQSHLALRKHTHSRASYLSLFGVIFWRPGAQLRFQPGYRK